MTTRRGVFLAAFVGLLVALGYLYLVAPLCRTWCDETQKAILDGSAVAPFRYRLLGAWLAAAMPGGAVALQYALAHFFVMPLAFALLFAWLKTETTAQLAILGCFLFAAYMLVFFHDYTIAVGSQIEIGLLALGLLWLKRRRAGVGYALLIAVGTLNRETTGLLLFLAALAHDRRNLRGLAFGAVAFAGVFVGLRLALGTGTGSESIPDILRANLQPGRLVQTAINHVPLLAFAGLVMTNWSASMTAARRRLIIVALPYVALVMVFGLWNEVRLWEPAIMLALPVALANAEG